MDLLGRTIDLKKILIELDVSSNDASFLAVQI
jgi:hypothetical protein